MKTIRLALLGTLPVLYLQAVAMASGEPFAIAALVRRAAFWLVVCAGVLFSQPRDGEVGWMLSWKTIMILSLTGALGVVAGTSQAAWPAWAFAAGLEIFLLGVGVRVLSLQSKWLQVINLVGLAVSASFFLVAWVQIETRFSEEEFFAVVQLFLLTLVWLIMLWVLEVFRQQTQARKESHGVRVNPLAVTLLVFFTAAGSGWGVVRAYQHSFFTESAPGFEGISEETPFLCGQVPASQEFYAGEALFRDYLDLLATSPNLGTPEAGMLALGTGAIAWAEEFHERILEEARAGLFTRPTNSIKAVQYDAALRVYYFVRVKEAFPGLFTSQDEEEIRAWFININRRAITVEWVDWMYATALSKWPQGLYENQEVGAGFLAILESERLAAPELSASNQAYLAHMQRGWSWRFRNPDDAYVYQPHWIFNAMQQAQYYKQVSDINIEKSFEWILLQALPDGGSLRYNHPLAWSIAGINYLGTSLTGNPEYLWMSGRALAYQKERGGQELYAQPGMNMPLDQLGLSPSVGSCLIYADSGLPNQAGPLAPDKIVFRDGWETDSAYMLLNLRFTGWHRYKAPNSVSLFYRGEPLVTEVLTKDAIPWLPVGRSLVRDKRIPRENLNGLVIARTRMSAVLHELIGTNGPWAQDPPAYAQVDAFETGDEMDRATVLLSDWHGWSHIRDIFFYHQGPVIVYDRVVGPEDKSGEILWHVYGSSTDDPARFLLGEGSIGGELVLVGIEHMSLTLPEEGGSGLTPLTIHYPARGGGDISLISVFLPPDWIGANVMVDGDHTLVITGMEQNLTVDLSD